MSQTRRLAAILAADVAGYSRLMGPPRPRGEGGAGTEFCLRMLQLTRSLVKGAAANPKTHRAIKSALRRSFTAPESGSNLRGFHAAVGDLVANLVFPVCAG